MPAAVKDSTEKKRLGIALAALIAAGVIIFYVARSHSYHPPQSAYFIDEDTGEESVRPLTDIPPLPGKNGKLSVVRVVKYSQDGGRTSHIAYYMKFQESTKKALEAAVAAGKNINAIDPSSGELVRAPEPGSRWVSLGSEEGQKITHIDITDPRTFVMVFP